MPQIGLWLAANIFTALLPPLPDEIVSQDEEERDYYEILGLSRSARNEDIRKAYKLLSLKLHPDKIAQRKETNAEDAARKYELVQEAYGVLINEDKRQRYHALQCSPRRYRFVKQGAYANPGALYENLTNARTVDKTRLVVLCTVIIMILFIQPVLIASKVNQVVEKDGGALQSSKWIALLVPTWIMSALWIVFYALLVVLAPMEAKLAVMGSLFEYIFWFVGAILFALKLDGSFEGTFGQAMIPVYLAMVTQWINKSHLLWTIRKDVGRMVTVEYLEKHVLKGKSLEELSEEEQVTLRQTYLVVTVSADFEPVPREVQENSNDIDPIIDEEFYEVQKVEASHEYEAAMDIYFTTLGGLVGSMLFGLAFVIVLTLKLDREIEASYWVVFIPIWIHHGSRLTYYFYQCACGTAMGEEMILHMQEQPGYPEKVEGNDETGEGSDRPTDNDFVDPNSSVLKFNADKSIASQDPTQIKDNKTTSMAATTDKRAKTFSADPVPSDEENDIEIETTTVADKKTTTDSKGAGETNESEADYMHIDEETFHAWQSAYEEAERGAIEEQGNAVVECCNLSVQLIVIIMVVAKIENSYWDSDNPNDPGFNTFWILFPFFLFFGLILCCCASLIYCAEPAKASDLAEDVGPVSDEENKVDNDAPVIVPIVPPPPTVQEESKVETMESPEVKEEQDVEAGLIAEEAPDMDELD